MTTEGVSSVTIEARGKRVSMSTDQWDRNVNRLLGRDTLQTPEQMELIEKTPPTWEELRAAHQAEEAARFAWEQLKERTKAAKADYDLAALELRALGRRMRNQRANPYTGEVD